MNRKPVLEARNVTKSFWGTDRTIEVLKGVDLAVDDGEVVMILGASGAGKSTLLHILGTLDIPDTGTVEVRGHDLNSMRGRDLDRIRNRTIGFIFQFHYLLPEFTALENVMMPRLLGGDPAGAARLDAEKWLSRVGLAERIGHRPPELSGGEQQRVAVARALINDPDVILADEPTGNLDDATSRSIHQLIRELSRRDGKTFVVVTHKKEFDAFSNRALLLESGVLKSM
jgi:lipoprotein-releasing system ATP-binding protein